jgi:hypothetical protein
MKLSIRKNEGLKLHGAVNPNDSKLKGVNHPLPDWNHFASLVIGPPGSGKTSLLVNMLSSPNAYARKFNRLYYFSGSMHTLPDKFTEKLNRNRVHSDLDSLPSIISDLKESDDSAIMIFDDLVAPIQRKENLKVLKELFFNRRHIGGGVALMIVSQKLKSIPLELRTAIDSIYYFSLKNRRELDALFTDYISSMLEQDQFDTIVKFINRMDTDHPFLYIDMRNARVHHKWDEIVFETE